MHMLVWSVPDTHQSGGVSGSEAVHSASEYLCEEDAHCKCH